MLHEDAFAIRAARTAGPKQMKGSGKLAVVSGELCRVGSDYTIRLT